MKAMNTELRVGHSITNNFSGNFRPQGKADHRSGYYKTWIIREMEVMGPQTNGRQVEVLYFWKLESVTSIMTGKIRGATNKCCLQEVKEMVLAPGI